MPKRLTGIPIITATRSAVSRASAGRRAHHVSVLAMLVLKTVRLASEMGSSRSHLVKARAGIWSVSHGLVVAGSKKARWIEGSRGRGVGVVHEGALNGCCSGTCA